MTKNSPRIAVIGAGYWGKNLVRVFNELGALAVVCDMDPERRNTLKDSYPNARITGFLTDIWNDKSIDAVVVSTPAVTHFDIAKAALENGKDVFVEKPLSLAVAEGEELVKLAAAKKKILFVGHVLHYHPSIVKIKELIDKGEIGQVDYIYSNRLNLGKFRNEENILWSFAPHDISLILSILKEYPTEISCTGSSYLHKKIADVTLCAYKFEGGRRAHIFVSWLHPTKEQKVVIVGSNGMMVFDDTLEPTRKLALYRHKVIWLDGIPSPQKNEAEFPRIEWSEPLRNECEAFLDAVQTREQPLTNGVEGVETLRLLNHSQQSLESGQTIRLGSQTQEDNMPFSVHPSSIVHPSAKIGDDTKIWHFCHVMDGAQIGKKCSVGQNVFIGKNVKIGNEVKIQNNVSVYERVEIGDHAFLGPSAVFTNVFNPRSQVERKKEYRVTKVGTGVTVGANATIVCGVTLGDYSFIGAGAVVTRDVKPYALVYGSPAKQNGWMCWCGVKLPAGKTARCKDCGSEYKIDKSECHPLKKAAAPKKKSLVS